MTPITAFRVVVMFIKMKGRKMLPRINLRFVKWSNPGEVGKVILSGKFSLGFDLSQRLLWVTSLRREKLFFT